MTFRIGEKVYALSDVWRWVTRRQPKVEHESKPPDKTKPLRGIYPTSGRVMSAGVLVEPGIAELAKTYFACDGVYIEAYDDMETGAVVVCLIAPDGHKYERVFSLISGSFYRDIKEFVMESAVAWRNVQA